MKFKKKKVVKYRGSKTHGGGAMKKRRGAGNRGGRGMAGSGKRGDAKNPTTQKIKRYFGKYGFSSIKKTRTNKLKSINVERLQNILPRLLEKKQAEKKNNVVFVDLKNLGYGKLLGSGNIKSKVEINVDFASKKAIEKVQSKGGKVNVLVVKQEKPKKEVKKKPKEEVVEELVKEEVKKEKSEEKVEEKPKKEVKE